jgi:hypothetical protein
LNHSHNLQSHWIGTISACIGLHFDYLSNNMLHALKFLLLKAVVISSWRDIKVTAVCPFADELLVMHLLPYSYLLSSFKIHLHELLKWLCRILWARVKVTTSTKFKSARISKKNTCLRCRQQWPGVKMFQSSEYEPANCAI